MNDIEWPVVQGSNISEGSDLRTKTNSPLTKTIMVFPLKQIQPHFEHSSPCANTHNILRPDSAKGSAKESVHPLRVKREIRHQCQRQGSTASTRLPPPHHTWQVLSQPWPSRVTNESTKSRETRTSRPPPTHPFIINLHSLISHAFFHTSPILVLLPFHALFT